MLVVYLFSLLRISGGFSPYGLLLYRCLDGALDDHLIYIYTGGCFEWCHYGRWGWNFTSRNVPFGN
jgi:hypothetical protein